MAFMTIRVDGDAELRAKLNDARADGPIERFLDRGAFYIQGQARQNAPVDRGQLRNSIGTESSHRERRVGSNVWYGPENIEFGTRPHFPPVAPLESWARRHGMPEGTGFLIARKISRVGTPAQPYLRPAAESGEGFIQSQIPVLAAEIERAFS